MDIFSFLGPFLCSSQKGKGSGCHTTGRVRTLEQNHISRVRLSRQPKETIYGLYR